MKVPELDQFEFRAWKQSTWVQYASYSRDGVRIKMEVNLNGYIRVKYGKAVFHCQDSWHLAEKVFYEPEPIVYEQENDEEDTDTC